MSGSVICPPEALEQFVAKVFQAMGADDDVAREVGRHLVRSNLSGHDEATRAELSAIAKRFDETLPSSC